ncbi:MAG: glycoside hydrolase [Actinobacteria bacterium]|nr:glycoside hydrolase [Actinomycetota bacterium]
MALGAIVGSTATASSRADRTVREVRVVAVDDRFYLADYASYATFEAEMRRLFELARPDLDTDGLNLVVYPESIGLWTAFLGPRGAIGRQANSAEEAIASLLVAHQPQIDFYAARFGVPPADPTQLDDPAAALDLRTLAWALVDPMTRAVQETFSAIADDEDVWLVSCSDQAPFEPTDDPTFSVVRDPEAPADSPTYVVPEDEPFFYNLCWVWNPNGEVVFTARKEYLVALEQDLLDITSESVDHIGVVPTEVGRLGFAISAPAWAHEVTQRLEQLDMHVQLQPDANPGAVGGYGWANAPPSLDNWQPDGWRMASWEQLSLSGSVQANVTPMATGTVLDFVMFDGQGHVMHQPRPTDQPRAFIGSPAEPGFSAIEPWLDAVRPWCPPDDPSAPLLERRSALVDCSRQLEPGAPHHDEEVEGVIAADVVLRERPVDLPAAPACSDCRATSEVAGRQWTPAVTSAPDGALHLVYRVGATSWDGVHPDGDIVAQRSDDGGRTWTDPVRVDDGPPPSNRPDDGAWHPEVVALPDGTLVVAYEDARESENVWVARSTDRGATWSPSTRVSTTEGRPTNGAARNGYHDLAVSDDGEVLLVYHGHDMANSAARVYAVRSTDGGATWTDPVVVDDTPTIEVGPADSRVVHGIGHAWRPAAAFRSNGDAVLVWQDFRDRRNTLRSVIAPIDQLGTTASSLVEADADGRTWSDDATTEWAQQLTPSLGRVGDDVWLAWEDTRGGLGHIRASRLACGASCAWSGSISVSERSAARERSPDVGDGGVLRIAFEREAADQGFAAIVATGGAGVGWAERAYGPGLAPAVASDGTVAVQATTGWTDAAAHPDTERIVVAAAPTPHPARPTPPADAPLPTTGGGIVGALAIALIAAHRRLHR